ncbi:MAG: leucine-rich repeat protein [Paludibacteraceae bacterium]|nr:leucine-rich repeat protein [Paludibacteraceae bacterium]
MMRLVKMLMRKYVKPVLVVSMFQLLPWYMALAQEQEDMDSMSDDESEFIDPYVVSDYQYMDRNDITDVTLSDSLLLIGVSAFHGCRNLMDVVIPNGCEEIMDSAFYGCRSLNTIEIPSSVFYVGRNAFPKNAVLIVKKKSLAEKYAKKFGLTYSYKRGQQQYIGGKKIEDMTLDVSKDNDNEDLSEISFGQYRWRNDIKRIIFPDSLFSIGYCAFQGCNNLADVTIPDGCERIYDYAFEGCPSLRTIKIPSSVKYIGPDAFPLDVTLLVEKGSYAEQYARNNGIDFNIKRRQLRKVIGPILRTQWNQPMDYFYQKDKYGEDRNNDGVCHAIALGQIFNHLGLNVYGDRSYATSDHVYYGDFDQNRADMNALPAYVERNPALNKDFYQYIENLAIASEHGWSNEEEVQEIGYTIEQHVPVMTKLHYMRSEGKVNLEKIIRKNLKKNNPVYASGTGHAVVIDGIREKNGYTEVHINFGWGGYANRWTPVHSSVRIRDAVKNWYFRVERIYEMTPLSKKKLKEWKPFRLTQNQLDAMKNETRATAELRNGTLYIPEGTCAIPPYHKKFEKDTTIKHISLPSTLQSLYKSFIDLSNVEELYIPRHVRYMHLAFFKNMKNLKKLYYDSEEEATCYGPLFRGCNKLKTIEFGPNVKCVPKYMLDENVLVKHIIWSESIERIGYAAFYHAHVKEIELPSSVKKIDDFAFQSIYLKTITIPNSVQSIGKHCFSEKTTIRCRKDSYAYKWAKRHKMTIEIIQ